MTISTTNARQYFDGNSVNKNFPFSMKFFTNSQIFVFRISASGVVSPLSLGTDYALTGAGSDVGGTVVTTSAPLTGERILVSRVLPLIQSTSLRNQGAFYPAIHEDEFDYLTMLIQQVNESDSNSLHLNDARTNWDARKLRISNVADPAETQDATTKGWVSSFFANLIDQVTGLINTTTGIVYDAGTLFDYLRFGVSRKVDSVAALRLLSSSRNQRASTLGYYLKGDGVTGDYFVDATDTTSADNGGTIIVGTDGARWKLAKTGYVSVKQFGAKGDGATDDTAAINRCLAAVQSTYFPATANGYRITGTLTVPNAGSNVFGDGGSFSSFLSLNGQAFDIFNVTAVSDIEIRNLYAIDFANRGSAPSQMYFARLNLTSKYNILNCGGNNIHSGISTGQAGSAGGGANSRIEGLKFSRLGAATGIGVNYEGNGEIRLLLNSTFAGPGSGADGTVNAQAGVRILGGTAIELGNLELPGCGVPVLMQPPAGSQIAHTKINEIWCDSSSSVGLWADGRAGQIINTSIDQSWFSSNGVGMRVSGYCHDLSLQQCDFYQNRSDAIIIDSNADVLGLSIGGGTRIGGNAGTGISVGLNVSGFDISNCKIGASSHFGANLNGILLAGGNNLYNISGNQIYGNSGQQIGGHLRSNANKIVKDNIGFTTEVKDNFSGATDANGLITVSHNMGRTPNGIIPSILAGTNPSAIGIQLVSYTDNTAVFKVTLNNAALASASVTVYFDVWY